MEIMFYDSMIWAVIIIAAYFAAMAVAAALRPGMACFSRRAAICVVCGALVGIGIGGLFARASHTFGILGMALSLAAMYVLFFSGVIGQLIRHLPERFRRGVRLALRWAGIIIVAIGIGGLVVGLLSLF